jgi:hypothetical protein
MRRTFLRCSLRRQQPSLGSRRFDNQCDAVLLRACSQGWARPRGGPGAMFTARWDALRVRTQLGWGRGLRRPFGGHRPVIDQDAHRIAIQPSLSLRIRGEGTSREHSAHGLPNLNRFLGKVRGLFRHSETGRLISQDAENIEFFSINMVGATGIEPVTPTMSR